MKTILFILSFLSFAGSLPAYAQEPSRILDCLRQPTASPKSLDLLRSGLTENKVAVYYVVPSDVAYSKAEYDAIRKASREIQAWYQINTGGVTYTFSLPDTVVFYQAQQNTEYYQEVEDGWWNRLLPEMQSQGYPIWQHGTVASIWIKTGQPNGIGQGAQSCGSYCGVALAGVENFPEFNDYGVCPDNPGGLMWPCVPHGTMAHELGHAFGLPHPVDDPATRDVAFHSIMQTHWNYPNIAPPDESPWGFLTVERTALWSNPFFQEGISLRQVYTADVVNLPVTGVAPTINLNYAVTNRTVTFSNRTEGAVLYYWTFGDGNVSNAPSPSHTYSSPGTYIVKLRASNESGMTSLQRITIEVKDPVIAGKKPKPVHIGPVKVYPNPSSNGRFTVSYPPLPFALHLTVLNAMGNTLFTHTINDTSHNQELDLSGYGRGIYYVRLQMKGATLTQKLVIL